jgi:1,4-alpha-glucan branching enzyme
MEQRNNHNRRINMSIKKRYLKNKGVCKVTFTVPESESNGIRNVHVVGEFNHWSTSATPMKRSKKGIFTACLDLESGREYQFRYLLNDDYWANDVEADKSADTPFEDARNSVIVL